MVIYRIKDWESVFENNRSRELKKMRWFACPSRLDGDGYTTIMEEESGAACYGCFITFCAIASRCQQRGTLIRDSGLPHDVSSLSRMTRIPTKIIRLAIERLSAVGWLLVEDEKGRKVEVQKEEGAGIPQEGAVIPQEGAGISHQDTISHNHMDESGLTEGAGIPQEGAGIPPHVAALHRRNGRNGMERKENNHAESGSSTNGEKSTPPKKRAEPSPHHVELKLFFIAEWEKRHGEKYTFLGARDGKDLRWILTTLIDDVEAAKKIVARYIANDEPWLVKQRHPLAILTSKWNTYKNPNLNGAPIAKRILARKPTAEERGEFPENIQIPVLIPRRQPEYADRPPIQIPVLNAKT